MIEFKNLCFGFKNENLFKNFNLKIVKNEFLSISGSSGVGKSSLLKLGLGLLQPKSGEIKLFDQTLNFEKKASNINQLRQKLFWVPQDVNIPVENIANLLNLLKIKKPEILQKFTENLEFLHLDLSNLSSKKFEDLSLGQKQRVLLALAFASGRELLVLDEPTAALDDLSINLLIQMANKSQACIFSISHNKDWNEAAHRVIFL